MIRPDVITTATCDTCLPWVRWIRTGSGAWVRQLRHDDHCLVQPHVQRTAK